MNKLLSLGRGNDARVESSAKVKVAKCDQDLLRRARRLERETLIEIYDEYSPRLYRYAARLLRNPDLAEECVSEVFYRFLNVLRAGAGPQEHLNAYLYRMAHNWINDQWRNHDKICLPLNLDQVENADLSQEMAEKIDQIVVLKALKRLTPNQCQVIVLRFYENWDNKEIAVALGKPPGAVKALQHRAVVALRQMLLDEERCD